MKTIIFTATAVLLFTSPVFAGMYKCTDQNGRISYQEQPCSSGISTKIDIKSQPNISDEDEIAARAEKIQRDKKRLGKAVRAKLDAGDISGARAIAVTPEDFNLIREAEDEQRKKNRKIAARHADDCNNRAIEVNRMRQDSENHRGDPWWLNRANAEDEKYRSECP